MAQAPYCTDQDVIDCCAWPKFAQLADSARARLIGTASEKIDEFCRRRFGFLEQVVEEILGGGGLSTIWLNHRPVAAIMSVTIDGDALDNTDGRAWNFDGKGGRLGRGAGRGDPRYGLRFPRGAGNVVVQYWGGYPADQLPDRLVTATAFETRYLWEQGKRAGLYQSENLGDYSYTLNEQFLSGTLPNHVADLLAGLTQDDAF